MRVDVSRIERTLRKIKKKNPVMFKVIQKKINEIALNPTHYVEDTFSLKYCILERAQEQARCGS